MTLRIRCHFRRLPEVSRLPILLACILLASAIEAQGQAVPQPPVGTQKSVATDIVAANIAAGAPGEHPLMPVLRWARGGLKNAERIQDYSATLVKRERVDGKLGNYEYMAVKVRHKPFSVYMNFLAPEELKGREVVYVEGRNDGKMWAHGTGWEKTFGTVSLNPTGVWAMRGQLYPVTQIGILTMIRRLVEVGEHDTKFGECEVKYYRGAKVEDRVCTCIVCIHPVPRRDFLFHKAEIFVDDELNLPIRYASYSWPKSKGQEPELLEEYSYLRLKLNNGFGDADFDIRNPNYSFK